MVTSSKYATRKIEQLRERVAKNAAPKPKRRPTTEWSADKREELSTRTRSSANWAARKIEQLKIKQNPTLVFTESEEPTRKATRPVFDFSDYLPKKEIKKQETKKEEVHAKEEELKKEVKEETSQTTEVKEEIDFENINPILDYTHTLPSGCKIHVLGIHHGAPGIQKPLVTDIYLKHVLAAHKGEVLIEGPSDSNPYALPPGYKLPAKAIEIKEVHDVIQKGNIKAFRSWRIAKILIDTWMGKLSQKEGDVKLFTKPITPAQEDKMHQALKKDMKQKLKKYGSRKVTQANLEAGLNFIVNTRSALMAASVLDRASKDKSHKAVIMGFAHASQVCRFLAKPEVGARYLKSIRYNFEFRKYPGKDAILKHIDDSIKAFEKQAKQTKTVSKQAPATHH